MLRLQSNAASLKALLREATLWTSVTGCPTQTKSAIHPFGFISARSRHQRHALSVVNAAAWRRRRFDVCEFAKRTY